MLRLFQNIFKKNSRGIALLMVLAALSLLSGVVVEFAYNSNVTYNLALNEQDRLQAFYLAQSGLNLSKLVIKFDKEAKKVATDASKKLGRPVNIQPLYEMIPIDTALIRGLVEMGGAGRAEGAEEENAEEEAAPGEEAVGEAGGSPAPEQSLGNFIDLKAAESFLAFNGDFSAEITEEDTKLNLSAFFFLDPKQRSYDRLKSILFHLLATDTFEGLFADRYKGAQELAQNIVDFIDRDEVYNEPEGAERGREGLQGDSGALMKNGKFLSLEELTLVPGMSGEVFQRLKPFVTIYGTDEKIFACRAEAPLLKAMILAYTENNSKMEPLKDDNLEVLDKAVEVVLNECPEAPAMSQELDKALGVSEEMPGATPTPAPVTQSAQGRTTRGTQPGQNTASNTFEELIKNEAGIYTVVARGTVGASEVKLKTVLDTTKGDARQWKELYWRVE